MSELHIYRCPICGAEEPFWGKVSETLQGMGFYFAHYRPDKDVQCGEFNPIMQLVEIWTDREQAIRILSSRAINYGRNWK